METKKELRISIILGLALTLIFIIAFWQVLYTDKCDKKAALECFGIPILAIAPATLLFGPFLKLFNLNLSENTLLIISFILWFFILTFLSYLFLKIKKRLNKSKK